LSCHPPARMCWRQPGRLVACRRLVTTSWRYGPAGCCGGRGRGHPGVAGGNLERCPAGSPCDSCACRAGLQLWSRDFSEWVHPDAEDWQHGSRARLQQRVNASHPAAAEEGDDWGVPPALRRGALGAAPSAPHARQRRRGLQGAAATAAAAGAGEAAAAQSPSFWARYANSTSGNASAVSAPETALRASLLESYDASTYPWSELGPANASLDMALHKILSVGAGQGQSTPPAMQVQACAEGWRDGAPRGADTSVRVWGRA